jgi:hypothetical protein
MLLKPEISAGLMGHLAHMHTNLLPFSKESDEWCNRVAGQDQGQGQGEVDGDFHQLPAAYC